MNEQWSEILFTILTTVLAIVGLYVRTWIATKTKDQRELALADKVITSTLAAVKATAQTTISKSRQPGSQGLSQEAAKAAKEQALTLSKDLLGSAELKALIARYGEEGANRVLEAHLEAAVHDSKQAIPVVHKSDVAAP